MPSQMKQATADTMIPWRQWTDSFSFHRSLFFAFFFSGPHPVVLRAYSCTDGISEIIPGWLGGHYGVPGIETRLAMYKA